MNVNKQARVIGYCRVSSDKQENSIDAQDKLIRAQATLKQWTLSAVLIDEDEFSGDLKRPGIQKILDLVNAKKVDAVICTKLDRLTRSTRDAISLIELFGKKGVALISISESLDTESPMGRFFIRMIASIAELEREMIGSRTRDGLQNIKAQGCAIGTAPYGYSATPRTPEEKDRRAHSKLVVNGREQEVLRIIYDMRNEQFTWYDIAERLNVAGYRRRTGAQWDFRGAHQIFKLAQKQKQEVA